MSFEWILNSSSSRYYNRFGCAPLSNWCFCLEFIFVSCSTVCRRGYSLSVFLWLDLSHSLLFSWHRSVSVCMLFFCPIFVVVFFLSLLFYGSFAWFLFWRAATAAATVQYDIILFFFELCKLVSRSMIHTERIATPGSHSRYTFAYAKLFCPSLAAVCMCVCASACRCLCARARAKVIVRA